MNCDITQFIFFIKWLLIVHYDFLQVVKSFRWKILAMKKSGICPWAMAIVSLVCASYCKAQG